MYDLIIIGAGPAGLSAGLYAGRYRLDTLILEKLSPGGQILLSADIENYPGFPGGIGTQELMDKIILQVNQAGVRIENAEVKGVSASGGFYKIETGDKAYEARSVIIASGSRPKRLGIPGEDKFTGRGVSYCATCDGPLFKNKEVAVIGGGDKAVEEGIFLSGYASRVNIIHRRGELRAAKILQEKAFANPKINFILESVAEEVIGSHKVAGLRVKNLKSGVSADLALDGVFIFAGIIPDTGFLKKMLRLDELGFIITAQDLSTSLPGLFACGDCRKKGLYQVVTACGEGAQAADSAHKYLLGL